MELPYYILLIVYLVGIIVFMVWTFFNMYHLAKFGLFDFTGKLNAVIFIGFSVSVVAITILLLLDIPWFDTFNLFSIPSHIVTDSLTGQQGTGGI